MLISLQCDCLATDCKHCRTTTTTAATSFSTTNQSFTSQINFNDSTEDCWFDQRYDPLLQCLCHTSHRRMMIIVALPSSQAVVTEIMSALDAFALSADELDIIMHKIANKQSVVKQDWSKVSREEEEEEFLIDWMPHSLRSISVTTRSKSRSSNTYWSSVRRIC